MARSALFILLAAAAFAPMMACSTEVDGEVPAEETEDELNTKKALFSNDVSILFSLPKGRDKDLLLSSTSSGDKGELLPKATFDKLPPLAAGGVAREDMRVVALRIDPCFAGIGVEDAACKNQLRVVLQPMSFEADDESISAKDAAVHAFYSIDRAELATIANEILAAKRGARGSLRTALGVHPLIEQQGLSGTFATDLRAIVLRHAGKANLSRVTFMTREASRQGQWKFGGFDIAGARHTKMKIASLGNATEQVFSSFMRSGSATPAVASPDDMSLFFRAFDAQSAPPEKVAKAYTAALRILNPTMHTPDTVDCVSCHTSTSARVFAEKSMNQRPDGNPANFTSRSNVSLSKSPGSEQSENLHAFSYLGTQLTVSQRTANESAAVVEYVNSKILMQR